MSGKPNSAVNNSVVVSISNSILEKPFNSSISGKPSNSAVTGIPTPGKSHNRVPFPFKLIIYCHFIMVFNPSGIICTGDLAQVCLLTTSAAHYSMKTCLLQKTRSCKLMFQLL